MEVKRQHRNLSHEWANVGICTNIQNGKVDSVWGSTPLKIRITSKKALNKSCSKLNFVQKIPRAHVSTPPFEPPSSTPGEDRHIRSRTFLYKIQLQTTFI